MVRIFGTWSQVLVFAQHSHAANMSSMSSSVQLNPRAPSGDGDIANLPCLSGRLRYTTHGIKTAELHGCTNKDDKTDCVCRSCKIFVQERSRKEGETVHAMQGASCGHKP